MKLIQIETPHCLDTEQRVGSSGLETPPSTNVPITLVGIPYLVPHILGLTGRSPSGLRVHRSWYVRAKVHRSWFVRFTDRYPSGLRVHRSWYVMFTDSGSSGPRVDRSRFVSAKV